MLFRKIEKTIYLDHAASTPVDPTVFAAMKPYFSEYFGNPSALHAQGVEAKKAVDSARASIAKILRTQPDTIVFTSGATEANNLALLGAARAIGSGHIITTAIEHKSVLEPIRQLEKEGFEVTALPVDENGIVSLKKLERALKPKTILVSVMYANNEIGSIQPIADIGRAIMRHRKKYPEAKIQFHTDATQAANELPLDVEKLHVDLMTLSGHKIYGPKGVGLLYRRRSVELEPIMYGGGQQDGLRSGTENVSGIVGLAKAVKLLSSKEQLQELQKYFWGQIQNSFPEALLNGPSLCHSERSEESLSEDEKEGCFAHAQHDNIRLANNLNIWFPGVDAEQLVLYLDAAGIACSTGSACSEDSGTSSHVLEACGYDAKRISESVRFSLGRETTKKQIDTVVREVKKIFEKLQ